MVDHIYGRLNILNNLNRPFIFINEMQLYVAYLKKELENQYLVITEKKIIYFENQGKKWINCISKKREIYPKNLYL